MATKEPQCLSNSANTCMDAATVSVPVPGYYCSNDQCLKCPIGTFGTDGKVCVPCPFAQWQPELGKTSCASSFTYENPGMIKSYIPYGVDKIIVRVWGGGGGSDNTLDLNYVTHSGGSGGYSACNMTVTNSQPVYVIVAGGGGANALTNNPGGLCLVSLLPFSLSYLIPYFPTDENIYVGFGGGGKGFVVTGYGPGGSEHQMNPIATASNIRICFLP